MTATIAVVHLPAGNAPRDKLRRKLGGRSLFEWIVRRVTECICLDQVAIVVAPGEDAALVRELSPPDVPVIECDGDLPRQLLAAAEKFGADGVVRVGAENPFVDPLLIDRLAATAQEHPGCDYIGYCTADGAPVRRWHAGVAAEYIGAGALRQAARRQTVDDPTASENAYRFSELDPSGACLRFIPLPADLEREEPDGALGDEGEWDATRELFDALGPDGFDWRVAAGAMRRFGRRHESLAGPTRDPRPAPVGGAL